MWNGNSSIAFALPALGFKGCLHGSRVSCCAIVAQSRCRPPQLPYLLPDSSAFSLFWALKSCLADNALFSSVLPVCYDLCAPAIMPCYPLPIKVFRKPQSLHMHMPLSCISQPPLTFPRPMSAENTSASPQLPATVCCTPVGRAGLPRRSCTSSAILLTICGTFLQVHGAVYILCRGSIHGIAHSIHKKFMESHLVLWACQPVIRRTCWSAAFHAATRSGLLLCTLHIHNST